MERADSVLLLHESMPQARFVEFIVKGLLQREDMVSKFIKSRTWSAQWMHRCSIFENGMQTVEQSMQPVRFRRGGRAGCETQTAVCAHAGRSRVQMPSVGACFF